jgi:hypothetical protein
MDTSIIKADIFFVVTTISVALVSVGTIIALVYIIRILKDLKALSKKAKDEGEKIIDDVRILREGAESKGAGLASLIYGIFGSFLPKQKSRRKKEEDK